MIQAAYDVLIASDFADPCDCAASVAAEVAAQHRLGLRTALVHIGDPRAVVDPQVRRLVAAGLTDWVSPRRAVTAALLLLRRPSMLAAAGWRLAARADTTLIVADQLEADAARADARVREEVGGSPRWAPVGPLVRSDLTGRGLDLTEEDWNDVVDIDALRSPTRDSRAGTSVIGRTSARFAHGWPESAAVLLAAYPEARSPRVAVLGSIAAMASRRRTGSRWPTSSRTSTSSSTSTRPGGATSAAVLCWRRSPPACRSSLIHTSRGPSAPRAPTASRGRCARSSRRCSPARGRATLPAST